MAPFLLGLALLVLLLLAARGFLRGDPKKMSTRLQKIAGIAALAAAAVLMVRGAFVVALPLAVFGLGLLGYRVGLPGGFASLGGGTRSSGQQSRVRTQWIEMVLDHDSGRMDGRVLQGRFSDKRLSELGLAQLLELWNECRLRDEQSRRLLEAYLDRVAADWREAAGATGTRDKAESPKSGGGRMTVEEAYEILGLAPGADAAAVRRAHRELMKKLHPDRGGSNYLAAKINQAKDVLLGNRR